MCRLRPSAFPSQAPADLAALNEREQARLALNGAFRGTGMGYAQIQGKPRLSWAFYFVSVNPAASRAPPASAGLSSSAADGVRGDIRLDEADESFGLRTQVALGAGGKPLEGVEDERGLLLGCLDAPLAGNCPVDEERGR